MDVLGVGEAAGDLFWTVNDIRLRQQLGSPIVEEREPIKDGWDLHLARAYLDRLSAPRSGEFPSGHTALLVCECGDLECGAITVGVDFQDTTVRWSDFRWQQPSGWGGVENADPPISFTFDRDAYLQTIGAVRERIGRAATEEPAGVRRAPLRRRRKLWWRTPSRSRISP